MKKIAFCFLIYDIINHEELWNIFFKNIDTDKYNIYIHYKTNVPLKYFEKYKLNNCIHTEWGHISLVQAQNILYTEALKDTQNEHFINLSGACIPVKPFNFIYNYLNDNFSYFNVISTDDECFKRCNNLLPFINKDHIKKASQWCILNRKHTIRMIENIEYINWFSKIDCPDEHCYIINIYRYNLQNEIIITNGYKCEATTFVDHPQFWCHPRSYTSINDIDLSSLLNSKSLFARKFEKEYNLIDNNNYIHFISNKVISIN
jgi:hypothetical protein